MFNNYYYTKKDIVIIPKSNDKNNLRNISKVDVKPNKNKSYENIRDIVESSSQAVDIDSKPIPITKNNLKNNIA
jgi:hypothetical protein